MSIAVTGATGHLGRLVIKGLKEQGTAGEIIALVRSPEKAADLGVTVRAADYDKPETLEPIRQFGHEPEQKPKWRTWSDDYHNLFQVLR